MESVKGIFPPTATLGEFVAADENVTSAQSGDVADVACEDEGFTSPAPLTCPEMSGAGAQAPVNLGAVESALALTPHNPPPRATLKVMPGEVMCGAALRVFPEPTSQRVFNPPACVCAV